VVTEAFLEDKNLISEQLLHNFPSYIKEEKEAKLIPRIFSFSLVIYQSADIKIHDRRLQN